MDVQESPADRDNQASAADGRVRRRRSPQERKALDYSKQRRNIYGENPEASRTGIRKGKTRGKRVERHQVTQELGRGEDADAGRIARRRFRKWPDLPLKVVLDGKKQRRADLEQEPVTTEGARVRRQARRSGKRRHS